jgi:RHS repeat-associated protein
VTYQEVVCSSLKNSGKGGAGIYRYGFNGMEKDDEVKGSGNSYDFGARIYDPRVGRFLSLDPHQKKYTDLSPYIYAELNPIAKVDVDGKYALFVHFRITKFVLKLMGVNDVQANLIAHYASVYADNPEGIRTTADYKGRSVVLRANQFFAKKDGFTGPELEKLKYNTAIDYSKTQNSQSEDYDAQLLHGTRTLAESNVVSAEFAVSRSVQNAWDNLFQSAEHGHINSFTINSEGMEKFGLALHTFQDVNAHQGAIFHPSWHEGLFDGMLSRHNEHSLWNDIYPESVAYQKAIFMSKSVVVIHQVLTGDFSNVKRMKNIYTDGMSSEQFGELSASFAKGGYSIKRGENGISSIVKNQK